MAALVAANSAARARIAWLDLRGSGLSAIERLCLEEALLRHDPQERCWGIIGTHEPTIHKYLKSSLASNTGTKFGSNCIIIMGLGGKPRELLDIEKVKRDNILTIKRFSGGGTVVVDHSCLWTTFIGRTKAMPHVEPFPRNIMQWSAEEIFIPVFRDLKEAALSNVVNGAHPVNTKRTLMIDGLGEVQNGKVMELSVEGIAEQHVIPEFLLKENDYILGHQKMGGNAQSIVKGAWLHHTSFLWDFEDANMEYLSLPSKRPEYRGDRSHEAFLTKLKTHFQTVGKGGFFASLKKSSAKAFELEEVSVRDALQIVDDLGGMQSWFDGKCRTKIVDL